MSANGRTESPMRGLSRGVSEFCHDLITLVELQSRLLQAELNESVRAFWTPIAMLLAGVVLALGGVPIVLACFALALSESTGISPAAAFAIAAAFGVAAAASLLLAGWYVLTSRPTPFAESQAELAKNIQWIKQTLRQARLRSPRSGTHGDI
jgi:hypothetical protein